ncbi:MAG TPA: DUF6448 family protein [Candidatus Syntrophosphaera sp.]|nr:DUF6448 family protein [Candidatus Syntrophosphaera sp.]
MKGSLTVILIAMAVFGGAGILLGKPILAVLAIPLLIAHCDTMDGPVVKAAKKALETGNVDLALAWVRRDDEGQIREKFAQTLEVRKLGPQARELADLHFFETLVRIHRAGEGESFEGIKPEGFATAAGIEAADQAVSDGSADALAKELARQMEHSILEKFSEVMKTQVEAARSVIDGRRHVAAYVEFIHYIEALHQLLAGHSAHRH